MPIRRHFRASALAEVKDGGAAEPDSLPPELEARIALLERTADPGDFDAASWLWMLLLGLLLPAVVIAAGWWLEAAQ